MDTLLQDLRYAVRSLRNAPGFAVTAALTLALGIGAATAGFTLLNWILLRPLPGITDPTQLGVVWIASRPGGGFNPTSVTQAQRDSMLGRSPAVAALTGHNGPTAVYIAVTNRPPRVAQADFVSSNYFHVLGTDLQLGRSIAPDDDAAGAGGPVAVISDELWQQQFGGRPDVIGQALRVNGVLITVIGVGPRGFRGPDHFTPADLWLPGRAFWDIEHYDTKDRAAELPFYQLVLRLRAGATFAQAERQLAGAIPLRADGPAGPGTDVATATVFPGVGLAGPIRGGVEHQLTLVMALTGLMLLVACANVANLLLFRRAQRRPEAIIRLALGASRVRLIRHFLSESVILGVLGACGGVIGGLWLIELFRHLPMMGSIATDGMSADWRVLAFAAAVGVGTSIAAGLIPAVLAAGVDPAEGLKNAGRTGTAAAPRLRTALGALQIAVSLALVAGTYLFARTLQSYTRTPLGFDPTGVTMFSVDPTQQGYDAAHAQVYRRTLAERVRNIPGVTQVAFLAFSPFAGVSMSARVTRADAPADTKPMMVSSDQVSNEYFAALHIPILRGRLFSPERSTPASRSTPGEVIVSDAVAHRLFGDADPVGAEFKMYGGTATIVGVAGDIHWLDRGGPTVPIIYQPAELEATWLMVRSTNGAPTRQVHAAALAVDPALPLDDRGSMSAMVAASLADRTLLFRLVGVLAALTLLLSSVGVYALIAYGVTTRTREFGIRMALGAGVREVTSTAIRPALVIALVGVAGGVGGAIYLTRFIASSLYGVSPLDPTAIVGASLLLIIATLVASWFPARRATRIDPMVALRAE